MSADAPAVVDFICDSLLRPNILCFCEGALPLLVAYLDERKPEASSASQILHLLCCQQVDQRNQHADLLARLQGVRRLSVMFCPQLQKGKGLLQAAGMAFSCMMRVGQCPCM